MTLQENIDTLTSLATDVNNVNTSFALGSLFPSNQENPGLIPFLGQIGGGVNLGGNTVATDPTTVNSTDFVVTRINPGEKVQTLEVWIRAFIPNNLSTTQTVQSGQYEGRTGVQLPGLMGSLIDSNIYLDDSRSFSNDPNASSKNSTTLSAPHRRSL